MKLNWHRSTDFNCWVYGDLPGTPPTKFALGDRLVYWQAGINTNNSVLRGSTKSNWGGWDFGYDLKAAIEWLQGASSGETKWLN